jgi:hypothetical protein
MSLSLLGGLSCNARAAVPMAGGGGAAAPALVQAYKNLYDCTK